MRNHFVPEFYFAPWLDERGHLYQFSRQRRGIVADKKAPGQICYLHDLHTLTGPVDPNKRDVVENWLTKFIDGSAAPVIKKILSQGVASVNDEEARALLWFTLAVIVRRPESVTLLHEQSAPLLRQNIAKVEKSSPEEFTTQSLEEWAEATHPGAIENSGRLMIGQIIADPKFGEHLMERTWWTVDYRGTSTWPQPTSDKAVSALGRSFTDPDRVLVLPLSPDIVLYGSSEGRKRQLLELGRGRLGLWTMRVTISEARRYVYGVAATNRTLIAQYLRS